MRPVSKEKQETPRTYKMIHFKNASGSGKRLSTYQNEKNSEYFGAKHLKREIENHYLDSSSASASNREHSVSSRGITIESGFSSNLNQENKSLKKELKKLSLQLAKYEKVAIQREDKGAVLKKLEAELAETYRVIQYYQGKTKELQRICRDYEQNLSSSQVLVMGRQAKASQMLQQQREHNIELRIELDKRQRQIAQMTRQMGNLSLKKVENEYQIKNLEKQVRERSKKRIILPQAKFIDDYEQEHLGLHFKQQTRTKRPISRSKRVIKASSGAQSSGQESNNGKEYRSLLFLRKNKANQARNSSHESSGLKATMYGNLQSKINNIEKQVQRLRIENEKLNKELDNKLSQIIKLKTSNNQLQMKLVTLQESKSQQQAQKLPQKVTISKELLKEISKPENPIPKISSTTSPNSASNSLSMFVSNVSRGAIPQPALQQSPKQQLPTTKRKSSNYKISAIKEITLRKLTVNVVKSELTYEDLVSLIAQSWSSENPNCLIQQLKESPCNLSDAQGEQFMREYKEVIRFISSQQGLEAKKDLKPEEYKEYLKGELSDILRSIIPSYKNITFRRQFTINIKLSNKFKNYEDEFHDIAKQYGNRMPYKECERCLLQAWGLSDEEFICLLAKNYDEAGDIEFIRIAEIGNFYLAD